MEDMESWLESISTKDKLEKSLECFVGCNDPGHASLPSETQQMPFYPGEIILARYNATHKS